MIVDDDRALLSVFFFAVFKGSGKPQQYLDLPSFGFSKVSTARAVEVVNAEILLGEGKKMARTGSVSYLKCLHWPTIR